MKVMYAAKGHIEKTESVSYVLEVPIKLIRVIKHAPNDPLEQQIRTLAQMTLSFASYAS